MARPGSDARLRRLLALVPWVAAEDGPTVEEVCARFGCTEAELVADLQLLFLCGVHPFTPDTLIEADIADGRVWIRYAEWFKRPLRLTPAEGLTLVAAGTALLAVPGSDPGGPLARALAKLARTLGVAPDEAIEIDPGAAAPDVLATVHRAAAERRQISIDYYAYGRDEQTTRTVDPRVVFSSEGNWYVAAYCHAVEDERLFRIDRIRTVTLLDSTFEPRAGDDAPAVYSPRPDDPVVVLELAPGARWVTEQYPTDEVEDLGDGRLRVRLRVSERPWLERLLLRLGDQARVVSGAEGVTAAAARRLLRRYGGEPVGSDGE